MSEKIDVGCIVRVKHDHSPHPVFQGPMGAGYQERVKRHFEAGTLFKVIWGESDYIQVDDRADPIFFVVDLEVVFDPSW